MPSGAAGSLIGVHAISPIRFCVKKKENARLCMGQ